MDIEHIEPDENVWHVQGITLGELRGGVARGLRSGLGVELGGSFRVVKGTIRFEDLNRQPANPPDGSIHHRNETLNGISDPELALLASRLLGPWALGGRLGVSIPLGHTVENPFRLGREGLSHEHIQLGTGTWDPVLNASVSRSLGHTRLSLIPRARLTLYANQHDYRAGNRYGATLLAIHPGPPRWNGELGLDAQRETAERWEGQIETEGNLGRTDVRLLIGIGRTVGHAGVVMLLGQAPLVTRSTGQQAKIPPSVALQWSR